ncbi:unnamed protein product [Notodromas monacha]|uniref:Alpha 1,4-glycosyltransferase domain-containing protein n=1 Tax=Notodromas monacha TaxID=399045 RepID=A0A7R9BTQ9_9CRUS|nr:unnamed protein product [Notodromas monacha]CAG0920550.1 unnamed protein product [Notodromas monacha]
MCLSFSENTRDMLNKKPAKSRMFILIAGCFSATLTAAFYFASGSKMLDKSDQDDNKVILGIEEYRSEVLLMSDSGIINSKLDLSLFSPEDYAKDAIYMMETSGRQLLSAKQLCSVESTARLHPSKTIVLLVASDTIVYPTLITSLLRKHPNVLLRKIDVGKVLSTSPLKNMDIENTLKKSKFVTEHASDLLRFALLYEHGGIYLDLDMIVIKKLPEVANGVATANEGTYLNPAFIAFQKGHPVLLDCMNHISESFNKDWFNGNGPDRITEAMKRWCNTSTLQPGMNCSNVYLFPVDNFTHLNWGISMKAFDEDPAIADPLVANLESNAFVFHYYNDVTRVVDANITGNSAIARMARKYCPLVTSYSRDWLFVTEHTSDLLRLVLLYEHGGNYMDFDMIVLKELPKVANGVATADDGKYLANGKN